MNAPSAQPGNNALTVTPSQAALKPNVLRSPSWVPLMILVQSDSPAHANAARDFNYLFFNQNWHRMIALP
jgi:hypothetical protein